MMSEDECGSAAKQQKLTDEWNDDQYRIVNAGSSNHQIHSLCPLPSPPIFKLTVDCCDEIFDYLSTKDLYSFGRTCKAMHKVAGQYFKRNCFGAEKFTHDEGIYTCYYDRDASNKRILTSKFNQYITNITQHGDDMGSLRYIESHCDDFDSVNNLNFVSTRIDLDKIEYFRKILPKIEYIRLHQCTADGNIYNILLQNCCENLTHLTIHSDFGDIIGRRNPWLLHRYPKLKQLHLCPKYVDEFYELVTFFKQNPTVEDFLTNFLSLWGNRNQLLNSGAKLNCLGIEDCWYHTVENIQQIFDLLKQLHGRGFYKRLHLKLDKINQELCEQMVLLPGLEKLHFDQFIEINNLSCLTSLKELHLPGGLRANEIEVIALNLIYLEKVTISSIASDDLLPFMRYSSKLIRLYVYLNGHILNLLKLNKERERLIDARKCIIFVRDNIFLNTKWTIRHGNTNLELVEMRRIDSVVPAKVTEMAQQQLRPLQFNATHRRHYIQQIQQLQHLFISPLWIFPTL